MQCNEYLIPVSYYQSLIYMMKLLTRFQQLKMN